MRSVTVRLDDLRTTVLNLGFVGENEHTQIRIDSKKMFDQYPTASPSLTVCPPEGESYPAVIERDGDFVLWTITDSDLVHEGSGEIQLSFTVSETVAKSYPGRIKVSRSIVPTGEIPEGIDDFLTRAGAALTAIPETIDEALAEAKASGEFDGPAGPAGQDGTDGYSPTATVSKSGKTATITITDKHGTTTAQISDGEGGGTSDYSDLENKPQIAGVTLSGNVSLHDLGAASESDIPDPTSIIDDTAGDGDTGKVWSADKSSSLLSEITNAEGDLDEIKNVLYETTTDTSYADVAITQIDGYNVYQYVANTQKTILTEQQSVYRAFNAVPVTPGEKYKITIKNFKATYSKCFYVVNSSDVIVYAPDNTASDETQTIEFTVPANGVKILINKKGSSPTPDLKKLVEIIETKPRKLPFVEAPVYYVEDNGNHYVRCENDGNTDFVHVFAFDSDNPSFSFKNLKEIPHDTTEENFITAVGSGSNFKGVNDDRCPLHLNGYYIGAGHGNPYYIEVTASHDKTEADIGSTWSDGTNTFTIITVGTGKLVVGCLSNGEVANVELQGNLTHSSGATHTGGITVTSSEQVQLRPCGNLFSHSIYGNNDIPVTSGQYYENIVVVDKYNILRSDAIFTYLQAHVGSNTNDSFHSADITGVMAVVENTYVFSRNGSVTVYTAVEFKSSLDFDYYGVAQSIALTGTNMGFVPDSNTLATPTTISAKTNFTWTGDVIPYRFYQILSDYSKGFGIIYETSAGCGNPTKRAEVCSESGSFANVTWKLYPHLFSPSNDDVSDGDYYGAVAARMPIKTSATMPSLCWYWVGDTVVLACDVASGFSGFIELPEYLHGKKITTRDVTTGLTIQNDFVAQKGIRIKNTTNAIAHMVVELN